MTKDTRTKASVYVVPHMDVAWEGFAPLDPLSGCSNPPPPLDKLESYLRRAILFAREELGGKFSVGPHSGTYCRELLYREPFVSLYREFVEDGAEIVVHLHEELVAHVPLVHAKEHMEAMILRRRDDLVAAGIQPTAFRTGYWAFDDCIPSILERAGFDVDLSGGPGLDLWYFQARWANAPYTAFYLDREDYTQADRPRSKSNVLEIPMGTDGIGNDLMKNYLYVEALTLAELKQIWDAIVRRAETAGEPQFVYFLCHSWGMDHPDVLEKLSGFVRYALSHAGVAVTPSEAKETYDGLQI